MQAEARNEHFDLGPVRRAFEAVWTEANYAALTEILNSLPVHWRQFAKTRLFEAVGDRPPGPDESNGERVRQAFQVLLGEHSELRAILQS